MKPDSIEYTIKAVKILDDAVIRNNKCIFWLIIWTSVVTWCVTFLMVNKLLESL
jgi:hypothetical protein